MADNDSLSVRQKRAVVAHYGRKWQWFERTTKAICGGDDDWPDSGGGCGGGGHR